MNNFQVAIHFPQKNPVVTSKQSLQTVQLKIPNLETGNEEKMPKRMIKSPLTLQQKKAKESLKKSQDYSRPVREETNQENHQAPVQSHHNLEPSMMAFLNLLKGKEGPKQQLLEQKKSIYASNPHIKITRSVGSAIKVPNKFKAQQCLKTRMLEAKKKFQKYQQLQQPYTTPTSAANRKYEGFQSKVVQNVSKMSSELQMRVEGLENQSLDKSATPEYKSVHVSQRKNMGPSEALRSPRDVNLNLNLLNSVFETKSNRKITVTKPLEPQKKVQYISSSQQKLIIEKAAKRKQLTSGKISRNPNIQQQNKRGLNKKLDPQVSMTILEMQPIPNPIKYTVTGVVAPGDLMMQKQIGRQVKQLPKPDSRRIAQHPSLSPPQQALQQHHSSSLIGKFETNSDLLVIGVKEVMPSNFSLQERYYQQALQHLENGDHAQIRQIFIQLAASGTGSSGELPGVVVKSSRLNSPALQRPEFDTVRLSNILSPRIIPNQKQNGEMRILQFEEPRVSTANLTSRLQTETQADNVPNAVRTMSLSTLAQSSMQQSLFNKRNGESINPDSVAEAKSYVRSSSKKNPISIRDDLNTNEYAFDKRFLDKRISSQNQFNVEKPINIKISSQNSTMGQIVGSHLLEQESVFTIDRKSAASSQPPIKRSQPAVQRSQPLIQRTVESELVNGELLQSDAIKGLHKMTQNAFKGAHSLPSSGEKQGEETFRLLFKRRHTVERTNLIVIKASDFLIQISRKAAEGKTIEKVLVSPACLTLIGSLLKTNQVAILIDFCDLQFTTWVFKLLTEHLQLQVDAIYTFKGLFQPSQLLLDFTQIVDDFCLFSEYQQSYKKTLANQSLFTFVEAVYKGQAPTRLSYYGVLAYDYTHVRLGSFSVDQTSLLNYLTTQSNKDGIFEAKTVIVDQQESEIKLYTKRAHQDFMRHTALQESNQLSTLQQSTKKQEELNMIMQEMRQKNSHVLRRRAEYSALCAIKHTSRRIKGGNRLQVFPKSDQDTITFNNDESQSSIVVEEIVLRSADTPKMRFSTEAQSLPNMQFLAEGQSNKKQKNPFSSKSIALDEFRSQIHVGQQIISTFANQEQKLNQTGPRLREVYDSKTFGQNSEQPCPSSKTPFSKKDGSPDVLNAHSPKIFNTVPSAKSVTDPTPSQPGQRLQQQIVQKYKTYQLIKINDEERDAEEDSVTIVFEQLAQRTLKHSSKGNIVEWLCTEQNLYQVNQVEAIPEQTIDDVPVIQFRRNHNRRVNEAEIRKISTMTPSRRSNLQPQ